MTLWPFALLSAAYVASLAVVDGAFNRLVFRELRRLPYGSPEKQAIYARWEWRLVGVVFLVVLPLLIPGAVSWALGGWRYLLAYLAVLLVVQWDMIFGRLVFEDWFGDTPSIALPWVGWLQFPLATVVIARLLTAAVLVWLLSR